MIKTRKFYKSQINLVKMSNENLKVINESCKCQSINKMKLSGNENEMRLQNEKNEKKLINVLAKHGITHDMRIKTKVVYGMPIWGHSHF